MRTIQVTQFITQLISVYRFATVMCIAIMLGGQIHYGDVHCYRVGCTDSLW